MKEKLVQEIRSFIVENFLYGEADNGLRDTVSLTDAGIIDSTGVLELVSHIETTYDFRMLELVKTIDSIAFKKMDERLLEYLDKKVETSGSKTVSVTHQQIAYDLNASREAISRLLKQMAKEGMVKLGRNKIEVIE